MIETQCKKLLPDSVRVEVDTPVTVQNLNQVYNMIQEIILCRGAMGNFPGGAPTRPEGPSIHAEARRAAARGMRSRRRGVPKKIFDF